VTSKKSKGAAFLSDLVVTDPNTGELIRKDTGEVISDNSPSPEKEWRSFNIEESQNRARVGTPTSLAFHDMGLATKIGNESTDASGNVIDAATRTRMGRLRMWNSRSQSHSPTERNLQQAFSMLSRIKDRLGLPNHVTEKAAYTYRKAQERGLIRGDTIGSVLAASIYVAARQSGVLRTLDDMIKRKALELMELAQKKNLVVGKDPISMAASILYLVNLSERKPRTQAEIAKAAGVTEVTVRNRSKELRKKLDVSLVRSTL
jgi:transcription initiation factor TFIIB